MLFCKHCVIVLRNFTITKQPREALQNNLTKNGHDKHFALKHDLKSPIICGGLVIDSTTTR